MIKGQLNVHVDFFEPFVFLHQRLCLQFSADWYFVSLFNIFILAMNERHELKQLFTKLLQLKMQMFHSRTPGKFLGILIILRITSKFCD